MFRMRVGLTVLSVALLGGLLLGQDTKATNKQPPPPRGQLPAYYKKLGLDDTQLTAVRKIRGEYRTKIEKLRQEITELQKEERTKLEQVLTPEQRTRLRALRAGEPATKDTRPPAKDNKDKSKNK